MIDLEALPPILLPLPGASCGAGGGLLKPTPSDFVVEEIPAYEPSGEGNFCYAWIEKEDVSGPELIRQVARRAGIPDDEVGAAGQKDRRAITRQWLSLPAGAPHPFAVGETWQVGGSGRITVLGLERHANKLKTGHLRGNRFEVRIVGRAPAHDDVLASALSEMATRGFANAFGEQRFGDGRSLADGAHLLRGGRVRDNRTRRFAISATQAALFNHWLAARVQDGLAERALAGDMLARTESGGVFWCDDPETDTARLAAGEVVVTGPLPGWKLRSARAQAGEREAAVLEAAGLTLEAFRPLKRLALGTRRPALVRLNKCSMTRDGEAVTVRFDLPAGSYATVALTLACGTTLEGLEGV